MLLLPIVTLLSASPAFAAGDDLLEEEDTRERRSSSKPGKSEQVREIVRGFYAKADVGGAFYLGSFAPVVNSGTYVSLAVGQDFVDQERSSMAWEVSLEQGLHNGVPYDQQYASDGCAGLPCTQGDLRTYALTAAYEYSAYPTRRLGVGGRAFAGILYSPVFLEPGKYAEGVADGEIRSGLHNSPHPVFGAGPTVEYYTKLSHFSVGADINVFYGVGWDLGMNTSGYLKYTF